MHWVIAWFMLAAPPPFQSGQSAPQVVRTDYDLAKVVAPPSLSEAELAGRKLFIQRCALCHDLLGQPAMSTVGPWLDGEVIKARGDSTVRNHILNGSRRMPGWRYTLDSEKVDQVIAYLKTVRPDQRPVARKVVAPPD